MSVDTYYIRALQTLAAKLGRRATRALEAAGCNNLEDIATLSPQARVALWAKLNAVERWSDNQERWRAAAAAYGLITTKEKAL